MYIYDTGVIHGRFQLFHNDHLKYVLAGKRLARHLYIGITNPDPNYTKADATDPKRSLPGANPFTYYERYRMITESLLHEGLSPREFSVVPLPINIPGLYFHYCPRDAVYFISIYDAWGRKKLKTFRDLGLKTYVLWEVKREAKGLSASHIRRLIAEGAPWQHMVPPPVAALVEEWHIRQRLKSDHCRPQPTGE